MFDRDGDGAISARELHTLFCNLGIDAKEEEVCDLLNDFDADGNGRIDMNEFASLMARGTASSASFEDELYAAFKVFDRDGNGQIDAAEVRQLFDVLNERISEEELRAMIAEVDTNKDGLINYVEFVTMMCK